MRTYLKDSNSMKIYIYMVDSTDHVTPEPGATVSVKVSKNGGAFGAGGGSVAELEEGVYAYTPSAGDVDTLGPIVFKATASGCDPFIVEGLIVAFDPYDSVRLGMTSLPNAAADAAGGLIISDAGGLDADALNTNVNSILADTGTDGVLLSSGTGPGQISLSSGTVTAGAISNNAITANAIASDAITAAKVAADVSTEIVTALKASTGYSIGTLTFAEIIQIIAAAVAGKVIDKAGVAGTVQHLDVEDKTTPIFENIPSNTTSPYRDPTIL